MSQPSLFDGFEPEPEIESAAEPQPCAPMEEAPYRPERSTEEIYRHWCRGGSIRGEEWERLKADGLEWAKGDHQFERRKAAEGTTGG